MSIPQRLIVIIISLTASFSAFDASGQSTSDMPPAGITYACGSDTFDASKNPFSELGKLSRKINADFCKSLVTLDSNKVLPEQISALVEYGQQAKAILLEKFEGDSVTVAAIHKEFGNYERRVLAFEGEQQYLLLPKLEVSERNNMPMLYFSPDITLGTEISLGSEACKRINVEADKAQNGDNCLVAFELAEAAFNLYQKSAAEYKPELNKPLLNYINSQWDKFLSEARSQTFLDVWLTTIIHDDYYSQDYLVKPASTQYFLLRPQIVYEHSKDISKGNRDRIGLAAEWLGINFWDWDIPLGLSAVSIYSDYEEEDSVGHGALLTINNSASIGWVKRGDSEGVFVTMDFLKLWQDKKEKLEQYKQDPWSWFE